MRRASLLLIPGLEGAGSAEALGESMSEFAICDDVVGFGLLGRHAEKAAVPALAWGFQVFVEFLSASRTKLCPAFLHYIMDVEGINTTLDYVR